MNRSYQAKLAAKSTDIKELCRKTAIHEAGHVAAIYLGNKQKNLPPVCFQLVTTGLGHYSGLNALGMPWVAKVDGGRLIHTLPSSVAEATCKFSSKQKQAYLQAFEADMVNLLVGPLAEANYIALRDDEIINSRLVNFNALHNYGGSADIRLVQEYLACLDLTPDAQEQKITEILTTAFNFINDRSHWRAIMGLAHYILADNKHVIECEEIISVLDAQVSVRRNAA